LRARFYDPVTASFLSVDPALSATGSPYAYASGNPLQLVDPLGLFSLPNPFADATNFLNDTVKHFRGGGSVSDMLGEFGCRLSGGFFDIQDLDRRLGQGLEAAANYWDNGLPTNTDAWKSWRQKVNVLRPDTGLLTAFMTTAAMLTGGDCAVSDTERITVCGGSWLHGKGGTMFGGVYITSASTSSVLEDPGLLEHEGDHSDMWALRGVAGFLFDYIVVGQGSVVVRDELAPLNGPHCNPGETIAGLAGGGYEGQCSP